MCGIVGFTGPNDSRVLRAMCDSIARRGPDGAGFHEADGVNMGMRRLAIVDIEGGKQPITNEDKTVWTVFNGEIYGFDALRAELEARGHRFSTDHSDTETIVHLYEEYGPHWAARVNGMFGLAIWDAAARRLLLYRDRMGKKPLYYAVQGSEIVFGSEIKALLRHPAVSWELSPAGLFHYFGHKSTCAPLTAYRDIRQLPPGSLLVWENGSVTIAPYWRADFTPFEDMDEERAARHLRGLIEDSVRLRMQCDAPFGAYLSGGVDSSTVATLMSRFHDRPLKTFCLGYEDEADGQFTGKAQDILHARRIAERIGSEHHEFFINARLFEKELPSILAAFDEPFSGTVSTYFLSILIRRHVKVAISGDGADELFASYLTHRLALPMRRLLELRARGIDTDGLDAAQRASLAPFDSDAQLAFLARIADEREEVWRDRLAVFPSAERARLLRPEFLDLVPAAARVSPDAAAMAAHTASDPLNAVLETEQVGQLPNQVLAFVDRLSMWHSIEVRCPFLDHRIVEFANRLPGSFKIAGTTNKAILKRAVADLLPADLIARPKEGFVQPVYSWMRGPLVPLVRQAFAELPKDVVARPYAEMLLQRFLAGDASLSARVWNLVCFSLWLGGL